MNAWKVILATLVIFGAGVITGGLLVSYAVHANQNPPRQIIAQPALNPWQVRSRDLLRRMDRELDLTPEQRKHIEKIIADSQERTKALWKPIAGPMNKEMQRLFGEIRNELSPDQQHKFNELAKPGPGLNRRHLSTNPPAVGTTTNLSFTNALPANP
ncbi:MAG TPA: hypothetical protein VFC07_13620 [Verrucomicrobiae bacterium]|nr:hypothetical protein [Verrucomicrobiae bacterium]